VNHPKPTALKILQGTDQPIRRNPAEAKPQMGTDPALSLSPDAQAFWDQYAPMLTRLGLLTEADGPSFTILCEAWAAWRKNLRGRTYHARAAAGRDREAIIKMLDRFGMNPSARTRVSVRKGEEANPVRDWMTR
jgi:phage terminase small subunit